LKWLDDEHGNKDCVAVVHKVLPGSPAEKAGLQVDDQLEYWGTQKLSSIHEWRQKMKAMVIGEQYDIGIHSRGLDLRLKVTISGTSKEKGERKVVASNTMAVTDN